ncbi:MAG: T9SS C-terminal target domain-containing protein [Haliscomenobacteraceae bacterium CHB4]|nr:Ycf48-like protein [Saprospiraceae bacterium]MCE7924078.1 T9SS C-terminal target domain-containing protein [Haliscomenobacteraceae bacterium CHB4]
MKKKYLLCLPILLATVHLFAQQKPSPIFIAPDAPVWMQRLSDDNPNVFEIQKVYSAYFENQPFEKNTYTQYYKRWMHWARPFVQADGSVKEPTAEELSERENMLQNLRLNIQERDNQPGWTFLGPKRTYDTDGVTEVTWQTNIYALDIAASNPNILYAGGESGGLWKTTDKGLHWDLLTVNVLHGAFGAVKIHPTDANTVYAATGGKIIKTTDGGATWTTVYTENNLWVNEIAIQTGNPDVVLAASDQGLLRTDNSGMTWTKIHPQQTWAVKFRLDDPSTVFAIRKNGAGSDFLISTDSGESFSPSDTGWWTPGQGEAVTGAHIALCPSSPSKIYTYLCGSGANLKGYIGVFLSNDNGATWANTHPQNAVGNSPVAYSMPTHTNLMTHNGVFSGFEQGFYDMAIIVNPNNDNQLIAGGTSWFKSNDGGATWFPLGSYVGGLPWSHPDIQALAAHGNDLWIASDGGLNYSTNFAGTIEARMNGISGSDMWGFDAGWNEDVLVGGRYHNGNMAWHESFPEGKYYRMGGAESPTGYVNPGDARKTYFSDIGGYRLQGGFGDGVSSFPASLFPNESYAYYANSEMAFDPRCWNHVYLGFENKIWKSTNGGTSFQALYAFPGNADNKVFEIEITRSNPDVIYCSQWDGADDAMWRSDDGGQTWSQLTKLPLPNNNDRVKMAVSAEDENVLWVAVTYGSNGKKIYKSANGGQSWENLTTSVLNGIRITNIMAQYGTDGGIYLGTNAGVFYRNNSLADWQPYSQDLPLSVETNRLKPFYKDGKIRNGCWGFGVWEADFYEPSQVVVQPMASTLETGCARDTVYFDDYSVVDHTGATWNWSFDPTPQFVSATDVRNPGVVFGQSGDYTATLTLNGAYQKSLAIKVENGCDADSIPGEALTLDGSGDYAVATENLNLNSNTVTLTAWIKRQGSQNDFAGIVFARGGNTTAGLSIDAGNQLRYHWNDAGYWFEPGLVVPDGEWVHVALVIAPTNAKIYLDGIAATHTMLHLKEEWDAPLQIGYDNGDRYFKGLIDEVTVWNKALTQNEIRELMHLAKKPENHPKLVAYYQFNETSGRVLDRVNTRHLSLAGDATRTNSTVAVGPGVSKRQPLTPFATVPFTGTGVTIKYADYPVTLQGEVCVTRINLHPDTSPQGDTLSRSYWVVRPYANESSANAVFEMEFDGIGFVPTGPPAGACKLWKRAANGEGASWILADSADVIQSGPDGTATFSNLQSSDNFDLGQFVLTMPSDSLVTAVKNPGATPEKIPNLRIYPNPAPPNSQVSIRTENLPGNLVFRLFDAKGNPVRTLKFAGQTVLETKGLPAGAYFYRLESEGWMKMGTLVVGR